MPSVTPQFQVRWSRLSSSSKPPKSGLASASVTLVSRVFWISSRLFQKSLFRSVAEATCSSRRRRLAIFCQHTPITSNSLGPFSESELRELIDAVGEGFTHIVIPGSRDWQEIKRRLQFDCRIHLARLREPIRDLRWPTLRERLQAIVEMDEVWLNKLSPNNLKHALLLPPTIFTTGRETADYWRHCDVYSESRFASAVQLLVDVDRHHWRPDAQGRRSWIDGRSRRYRIDPAKHARSQADRAKRKSYRFCFEIPPGFHYDVTDDSGKSFSIEIDGRAENVMHCNVTPWGRVRRG